VILVVVGVNQAEVILEFTDIIDAKYSNIKGREQPHRLCIDTMLQCCYYNVLEKRAEQRNKIEAVSQTMTRTRRIKSRSAPSRVQAMPK
jgi:hypothetical protein